MSSALAVGAALHLVAKANRLVTVGASLGTFAAVTLLTNGMLGGRKVETSIPPPPTPTPVTPTLEEQLRALNMPQEVLNQLKYRPLKDLSFDIVRHYTGLQRPPFENGAYEGKPIHLVKLTFDDLATTAALDVAIERETAGFVEFQPAGDIRWVRREELERHRLLEKLGNLGIRIPLPPNYDPSNEAHRKEASWKIAATFTKAAGLTLEVTDTSGTQQIDVWKRYDGICFTQEQLTTGELTRETIQKAVECVPILKGTRVRTWRDELKDQLWNAHAEADINWAEGDLDQLATRQEVSRATIGSFFGREERETGRLTIAGKEYEGLSAPPLDARVFTETELRDVDTCWNLVNEQWVLFETDSDEIYFKQDDAIALVKSLFPETKIRRVACVTIDWNNQEISAEVNVDGVARQCELEGKLDAKPWQERLTDQLTPLGIDLDLSCFGTDLATDHVLKGLSDAILTKHLGVEREVKSVTIGLRRELGSTLPPVVFTGEELLSLTQATIDERVAGCIRFEAQDQPTVWLTLQQATKFLHGQLPPWKPIASCEGGVQLTDNGGQTQVTASLTLEDGNPHKIDVQCAASLEEFRIKHVRERLRQVGVTISQRLKGDPMNEQLKSLLRQQEKVVGEAVCDKVGQVLFGIEPTKKHLTRQGVNYPLFPTTGCPPLCTATDLATLTRGSLEELKKPAPSVTVHFTLPTATRHHLMRATDVRTLLSDMGLESGVVTGGEITITGTEGNYTWSGTIELNGETQAITHSQGPRSWSLNLN